MGIIDKGKHSMLVTQMLAMLTVGQQCKCEVFQVIFWDIQFREKHET